METNNAKYFTVKDKNLLEESASIKSGMGSVAWAVLEMFRRGGMPEAEVKAVHAQMDKYFPNPSNEECNTILRVVEERMEQDREEKGRWYSQSRLIVDI